MVVLQSADSMVCSFNKNDLALVRITTFPSLLKSNCARNFSSPCPKKSFPLTYIPPK
jgi:hypothetical protein